MIEFEPLPFAVDPIASLRPGSANARDTGNVWMRPPAPAAGAAGRGAAPAAGAAAARSLPAQPCGSGRRRGARGSSAGSAAAQALPRHRPRPALRQARPLDRPPRAVAKAAAQARCGRGAPAGLLRRPEVLELKWTEEDFAAAGEGQLPLGKHTDEWVHGDVDAAFKDAALVLDETFVGQNTSHQVLEPRTAMAYWQNGKLYLHAGTQSTVQTVPSIARWIGTPVEDIVLISEYTGGGFGSRIPGYVTMAIPALLSKKANAPVQMRITREEDHYIGRARPALHSRVKVGVRQGRPAPRRGRLRGRRERTLRCGG